MALRVMEEGSCCDAPVMAEYFGGILAASRSKNGEDDRGASWAGLVARLSTFDVYLHYLVYKAFRQVYLAPNDLNLGLNTDRDRCEVYLPAGNVLAAMSVEVSMGSWLQLIVPSINALIREDLLGEQHSYGDASFLAARKSIDVPDVGLIFTPSVAGVELFLWAHGHAHVPINGILDPTLSFEAEEGMGSVRSPATLAALTKARAERLAQGAAAEAPAQSDAPAEPTSSSPEAV